MKRKCRGAWRAGVLTRAVSGALMGMLVSGCGGGSDAADGTRASNASAQAQTLNENSMALAAAEAGATAAAVQTLLDAQRSLFEQAVLSAAVADILAQEAQQLAEIRAQDPDRADQLAQDKTQLAFTSGLDCADGGSLSLTWTDVDLSKSTTAGDVLDMTASHCAGSLGAAAISGGLTVNITRLQVDATGQATAGELGLQLSGVQVGTHSVSGAAVVDFSAQQQRLISSDLTAYQVVTQPARYQLQADADRASGQLRLQGQIDLPLPDPAQPQGATNTWVQQALKMTTDEALRFENGHPVQGQLRLVAQPGDGSTGTARFTAEGSTGQLIGADGTSSFSTGVVPW